MTRPTDDDCDRAPASPPPESAGGFYARMAHARRAAGQPLDDRDHQALAAYPECPPLLETQS
jgi:hypothetical protein